MRTHGHRAARIDPLDLIHREEVAALSPERYGLTEDNKKYNVNGILWTKRVGELGEEAEWWTLKDIQDHLRTVYVGNIAYEVLLHLFHLLASNDPSVYALAVQDRTSLVQPFT